MKETRGWQVIKAGAPSGKAGLPKERHRERCDFLCCEQQQHCFASAWGAIELFELENVLRIKSQGQ